MAITHEQLINIGFKPSKRANSLGRKKYDTLIFSLNETDYLFLGYNVLNKKMDFKKLWKSVVDPNTKERYSFQVDKIKELTLSNLSTYLIEEKDRALNREKYG